MGLNELKTEFGEEIAGIVDDLSNSLPLSRPNLRSAFTDQQLTELHKLIVEVNAAIKQNEKIARLQENAKAALSLLKKLGVAL